MGHWWSSWAKEHRSCEVQVFRPLCNVKYTRELSIISFCTETSDPALLWRSLTKFGSNLNDVRRYLILRRPSDWTRQYELCQYQVIWKYCVRYYIYLVAENIHTKDVIASSKGYCRTIAENGDSHMIEAYNSVVLPVSGNIQRENFYHVLSSAILLGDHMKFDSSILFSHFIFDIYFLHHTYVCTFDPLLPAEALPTLQTEEIHALPGIYDYL